MHEAIVAILARHTGFEPEEITPGMDVRDDLGLDSLDAVELLMAIEHETGLRFSLDDIGEAWTVGDIVSRLSVRPGGDP